MYPCTRGNNVLDLLFCLHSNFISSIEITPGISDHEAILYCLDPSNKPLHDKLEYPIYLYHKGNIEGLK